MTLENRTKLSNLARRRWANRPIFSDDLLGATYAMKYCVVHRGFIAHWTTSYYGVFYWACKCIIENPEDRVEIYEWDTQFKYYRLIKCM